MKTNPKGFTIPELILTIAIVGIVALVVFQSTRYGMNVFRRTNNQVNEQALKFMRQIGRDLRCAFLASNKYPAISFMGTASSMKFISTAPLDGRFSGPKGFDLKEKRYYLAPKEEGQKPALICSARDLAQGTSGGREEDRPDERQTLSSSVDSLGFAYFDGREWLLSWNSLERLPEAVRITVQFRENGPKNPLEYFSTVIMLPGA